MNDLISRQAALESQIKMVAEGLDWIPAFYIEQLPSAERRGRWEFNIDDEEWSWDYPYMCDQCREQAEKEFNFCPNCGAKMDGE